MFTPGAPLRIAAAKPAAASITCSQLSSSSSIRLSLRAAIRPGSGFSLRISRPSTVATALCTRRGSPSGARYLLASHRGNEIVTAPRHGEDVAIAALAVTEGAAQGAHLDLEVRFLDERLRPGSGDQLFLGDHLTG